MNQATTSARPTLHPMSSTQLFLPVFLLFFLASTFALPVIPSDAQQETSDGVYFVQPLHNIMLTGDIDSPFTENDRTLQFNQMAPWAYVSLDQPGEALLQFASADRFVERRNRGDGQDQTFKLAIRLDEPAEITGTLYFPVDQDMPFQTFRFVIKADSFNTESDAFLKARHLHYERLWNSRMVGGAWFRHQTNVAAEKLGQAHADENENRNRNSNWQTQTEIDRSLSMVSGGIALSENLQLDRMLDVSVGKNPTQIPLADIEGITVKEFNWEPLVNGIDPALDPLAALIPSDQHVMFVPSFEALVTLIETGFETAGPLLPVLTDSSESADTRQRYQRQLGLPLGRVQKIFGPKLIDSIAITGGDPYFRTGTDVALLFESSDAAALAAAIQTTIKVSGDVANQIENLTETIGDVECQGYVTANRNICSWVATLGNVVVVANSPKQLDRIISTKKLDTESLAVLDEYRFFRDRYPRTDEDESALIIISDQTIRRWCSPRWRIATSRRTRAAAVMTDLHAKYLMQLVAGVEHPVQVEVGPSVYELNRYSIEGQNAISETYGTLAFQTPISELEFDNVSEMERDAYQRWRQGYQSNWSNAFDPIAVQIKLADDKLSADMTVLPLIDNSEYEDLTDVSLGAELDSQRNSGHAEAIAWAALALNKDSSTMRQWANVGSSIAKVNILDWVGDAVVLFVDEDPFWTEMEQQMELGITQEVFLQSNVHRLPIAIQVNVRSKLRLTAFLVGLRGFIEQSVPDMTVWETIRHRDTAYVKVGTSKDGRRDLPEDVDDNIGLFYLATGDTLILSLSEPLIQRAIDRRLDSEANAENEVASTDSAESQARETVTNDSLPLQGKNVAIQIKRAMAMGLLTMMNDEHQRMMQRQSWSALPILNEWKKLYPDRDPMEIDRLVWKRELICPGGGEYRWNDQWKTMESTVYGHPGEPKKGPHIANLLGDWDTGNFGLTFENDGLRARVELIRKTNR